MGATVAISFTRVTRRDFADFTTVDLSLSLIQFAESC